MDLEEAEIISSDSMQVYRYMDIGTAKPCDELMRSIPHHLVSIVTPDCQFNVGEFLRRAERIIHGIVARGKRPIVAGGTAYYIRSFAYGLSSAPRSSALPASMRWDVHEAISDI